MYFPRESELSLGSAGARDGDLAGSTKHLMPSVLGRQRDKEHERRDWERAESGVMTEIGSDGIGK